MEENLSPQQSLQLIESMIRKVRNGISENRFYFLVWGWFIFLAILLQFFLKAVLHYDRHYLVWLAAIPVVVITAAKGTRDDRSAGHRTYIGESMVYVWMGIGIGVFVLGLILTTTIGWMHAWPFYILFWGLGTFISGKLLKFRPLVVGGLLNWALACVCALLPYDYQLLTAAAAVLAGYIIPGHIMQPEKNKP